MSAQSHVIQVPRLWSGQVLSDLEGRSYAIANRAGTGGLGHVYRAHSDAHGDVAIKLPLRFHHGADMLGETRWTYRRPLANVAPVLAIGTHQFGALGPYPVPFMVMPFYHQTMCIASQLRGPCRIATAATWIADIAQTLDQLRIVHRDLKLENLFLDHNDVIHVADFGLALPASWDLRIRCGMQAGPHPCGTPDYMPPEQFAADPKIDCRADIFALGLILYEMLTARIARATPDVTITGMIDNLRTRGWGPRAMHLITDQAIAEIITTCCQASRSARYQNHQELVDVLTPHCARLDDYAIDMVSTTMT